MCTSCGAIGDAWLMIMMPAETLRTSINHDKQALGRHRSVANTYVPWNVTRQQTAGRRVAQS